MKDSINERIARCRKAANLTQAETAEKMNMKSSAYSQMERKGSITTDRLLKLAEIFGVDSGYILHGDPQPAEPKPSQLDFSKKVGAANQTLAQDNDFSNIIKRTPPPLVFTKMEENMIKIMRNLPKQDRNEIFALIQEKYQKNK